MTYVLAALALCCCSVSANSMFGTKQGKLARLMSPEMEIVELQTQLEAAKEEIAQLKKNRGGCVPPTPSPIPKVSMISVQATPMDRSCLLRLPLTIESMRLNPNVSFHVVNLVDEQDVNAAGVQALKRVSAPVNNVHVHVITIPQFRELVKIRLQAVSKMPPPQIQNASQMVTKAHDYKPTFGVLWAPFFEADEAEYWGWFDMDQIFGNFQSVLSPYIPENDMVMSCLGHSCGPFMLFRRKFRTIAEQQDFATKSGLELSHVSARFHPITTIAVNSTLFMERVAEGRHSMADEGGFDRLFGAREWKKTYGPAYGTLKTVGFTLFLEELMSVGVPGWTRGHKDLQSPEGIVLWREGKLTVLATGRELLLYHRVTQPHCLSHLDPRAWKGGKEMAKRVRQGMMLHGYFLPDLAPVKWYQSGYYIGRQGCFGWGKTLDKGELDRLGDDEKHWTADSHGDFVKRPKRSPYNNPTAIGY
jgi:hypothetical protein